MCFSRNESWKWVNGDGNARSLDVDWEEVCIILVVFKYNHTNPVREMLKEYHLETFNVLLWTETCKEIS